MQLFEYDRATHIMESAGIDIILATTRHGVEYLSGGQGVAGSNPASPTGCEAY
jgi:hypothetical protein